MSRPGAVMAAAAEQGERLREALAELEETRARLAAAEGLLAAIAELAEAPSVDWPAVGLGDGSKTDREYAEAQRDRARWTAIAASSPAKSPELRPGQGWVIREEFLREQVAAEKVRYPVKAQST